MSGLEALCARTRPQLAVLGELGLPLLAIVEVVERVAGSRGPDVLMKLFRYFPDELRFTASDFVGRTVTEARALRHRRDVDWLKS
jgi:hypothetical protein